MKNRLAQYSTNFENMWKSSAKTNKLLGKLLESLLKIHLTPKREQAYKQLIKEKAVKQEKKKKVS